MATAAATVELVGRSNRWRRVRKAVGVFAPPGTPTDDPELLVSAQLAMTRVARRDGGIESWAGPFFATRVDEPRLRDGYIWHKPPPAGCSLYWFECDVTRRASSVPAAS